MSASADLQRAIYAALGVQGRPVFDAAPAGEMPEAWIALGPERVRDASDGTAEGSVHLIEVICGAGPGGFVAAKEAAAEVDAALEGVTVPGLVSLRRIGSRARIVKGGRRVVQTWRARIDEGGRT